MYSLEQFLFIYKCHCIYILFRHTAIFYNFKNARLLAEPFSLRLSNLTFLAAE